MADVVDLTNDTLYPEVDNGFAMAGPPPAVHRDVPLGPVNGKPDLRTKEGRAAAGLPPITRPDNTSRNRTRTAGGPPPVKKPGVKPGTKPREDYRPRILGVMQLVALPLAFRSPADGAAVEMHAPNIAQALHDLAMENPEVAAVLDRILKVGPYAALFGAVAPLILQLAVNHNAMPAGILGTVPPDVLLGAYVEQFNAQR